MGLDARVGNIFHMRMGPYSSVQSQRRKLTELAIKYCQLKKEQAKPVVEPSEECSDSDSECIDEIDWDSLAKKLESWLDTGSMIVGFSIFGLVINYKNVATTTVDELAEANLAGLKWFVEHSDCEGYWSPGQCVDIMWLFNELRRHNLVESYLNDEESEYYELLKASVENHVPVTFC